MTSTCRVHRKLRHHRHRRHLLRRLRRLLPHHRSRRQCLRLHLLTPHHRRPLRLHRRLHRRHPLYRRLHRHHPPHLFRHLFRRHRPACLPYPLHPRHQSPSGCEPLGRRCSTLHVASSRRRTTVPASHATWIQPAPLTRAMAAMPPVRACVVSVALGSTTQSHASAGSIPQALPGRWRDTWRRHSESNLDACIQGACCISLALQ